MNDYGCLAIKVVKMGYNGGNSRLGYVVIKDGFYSGKKSVGA